jgi:hypothetical protein
MSENPYLPILYRNLPRLLAGFNTDPTDPYYGCGDRFFWAWKLIDFPNATFQGASLGLARLYEAGMLPDWLPESACLQRIEAMIAATPALMDRRGGLAEALPNEGSFCVTGLVLADHLGAVMALGERLPLAQRNAHLERLAPLAAFLLRQDEHHGMISNHLATSALALVRWHHVTGDAVALARAKLWLARIAGHANAEGWMREYHGADPGYQSWCSSALAEIHALNPALVPLETLGASYRFLGFFAMPDGSFANGCGARLTRFFFAGGAEAMAAKIPEAAALAQFARQHLPAHHFVTLDSIDAPNLVPFFNDAVLAAISYRPSLSAPDLPFKAMTNGATEYFKDAGFLIHKRAEAITLVALSRGGWMLRVPCDGAPVIQHGEPLAEDARGRRYVAGSAILVEQNAAQLTLQAPYRPLRRMMPSPFKTVILRALSLTAFHSLTLGNLVKRALAAALLRPASGRGVTVTRQINLATGEVQDRCADASFRLESAPRHFSPQHMASQGYWQRSDDVS